jgi:hypothetical protein
MNLRVHTPMLVADASSHMNWTESAGSLAGTGAAWVVANSLAPKRLERDEHATFGGKEGAIRRGRRNSQFNTQPSLPWRELRLPRLECRHR